VGALVATLAGCAGAPTITKPTNISSVYIAQIDTYLASGDASAFEKQVLSDYVITDAEYAQAQQMYVQCMANQGYVVTFHDNGSSDVTASSTNPNQGPVPQTVSDGCSQGTIAFIQAMYISLKYNPQNLSAAAGTRQCYEEHGITDGAGLSDDQFAALIADTSYFPSTPQGDLCLLDPFGFQGLTADQAAQMIQNRGTATFTTEPSATGDPSASASSGH